MSNIMKQPTPLLKNIHFVVTWNRWIEKQSDGRRYIRIRIEHDEDRLINFFDISNQSLKFQKINTYEEFRQHKIVRAKKFNLQKHFVTPPPLENPATVEDVLNSPWAKGPEAIWRLLSSMVLPRQTTGGN